MVKSFILDTNVILSSGSSGGSRVLYGFGSGEDANEVIITGTTLQELDRKKSLPGEIGYNARDFARVMDDLRQKGDLFKGVPIDRGMVYVEPDGVDESYLPKGFSIGSPDNRIISSCIYLAKRFPEKHFVYVSNDVYCRLNADACFKAANVDIGIEAYKNDYVAKEEEYQGYEVIDDVTPDVINDIYKYGTVDDVFLDRNLYDGEYLILKCGQQSAIACHNDGVLSLVKAPSVFGIKKLYNAQQIMAMHALMAPPEEIPLVILTGAAGSGKTFLPVAAGIDGTYDPFKRGHRYNRMIISRSNSLNRSEDLGFLPGDIDEKMSPLIQPIRDSIENLLTSKDEKNEERPEEIEAEVDEIFMNCIDVMPMLYVRGRSLKNKFLVLDEAQNATKQQVFDVISRASTGTKVVLTGDVRQVDNTLLDRWTNGLTFAVQQMRGKGVAIVNFGEHEVVRSFLAKIAIERMQMQIR